MFERGDRDWNRYYQEKLNAKLHYVVAVLFPVLLTVVACWRLV